MTSKYPSRSMNTRYNSDGIAACFHELYSNLSTTTNSFTAYSTHIRSKLLAIPHAYSPTLPLSSLLQTNPKTPRRSHHTPSMPNRPKFPKLNHQKPLSITSKYPSRSMTTWTQDVIPMDQRHASTGYIQTHPQLNLSPHIPLSYSIETTSHSTC